MNIRKDVHVSRDRKSLNFKPRSNKERIMYNALNMSRTEQRAELIFSEMEYLREVGILDKQ